MDEHRWRSLQTIFHHAAQLPQDDRPSFVADACGEDADMKREVEALLAVYDEGTKGLAAGGAAPSIEPTEVMPPHTAEGPGTELGPYRLIERLGEGGFGVVYRAEQRSPVRREVALKIIRLGMDTEQVIARFEAERQALALMDHPNIAKVFDAGATERGRPYFVMELVRGVPITQYCDQHNLSMRERLNLIIQVCHAVQHAHQKGIIHRDLKPSNVLVTIGDDGPAPKVIDFGIAKATSARLTERTYFTEHRQFIGTPEYMSPEQADPSALDIDTRSDVYALGVLMYELLTGTTPFEPKRLRSAAFNEIQRIIREEDPQKPSTRISSLQSELATAQRSARDSDAAKTPPSGGSHEETMVSKPLTADSESETSIEEIARHRRSDPSSLSRLMRGDLDWIVMKALEKDRTRRYETASALAEDIQRHLKDEPVLASPPSVSYRMKKFARRNTGLLAGMSAVAAALVLGAVVATIGFIRASDQRDRAVKAEGAAIEERNAAIAAEEEAVAQRDQSEAVTDFLSDMLAAVDPAQMGRDVTVRQVLDEASLTIEHDFNDRPLVRARLRNTMGQSYMGLGLYEDAEPHLLDAFETYKSIAGPDHADTLQTMEDLGSLYRFQSRIEDAESMLHDALDRSIAVNGEPHAITCIALINLGGHYRSIGRFDEANAMFQRALDGCMIVFGEEHEQTMTVINNLGFLNKQIGEYDEAEQLLNRAWELRVRVNGPEHPKALIARHNISDLHIATGNLDEAEAICREVYDARRRVLGDEHPDTLLSLGGLANCALQRGDLDECERINIELLEANRRALGEDHIRTLTIRSDLAFINLRRGRADLAQPEFASLLEAQRRVLGPEHPSTLTTMNNLAGSYVEQGNFDDAFPILEEALAIRSNLHGDGHPSSDRLLRNLGGMYRTKERWADALPKYQRRLAVYRERYGEDDPRTDGVEAVTVEMLIRTGAFDEAEPMALRVFERRESSLGIGDDATRRAIALLIKLNEESGREEDAATWRRRADESIEAGKAADSDRDDGN